MSPQRSLGLGGALALWAIFSGCATAYPSGSPAPADSDCPVRFQVSALDYELSSAFPEIPYCEWPRRCEPLAERLQRELELVSPRVESGVGHAPLHLAVSFESHDARSPVSILTLMGSILTLGVLPNYWDVQFELRAQALWNGAPRRGYGYSDEMQIWLGWPLLPVFLGGAHRVDATSSDVVNRMIRRLTCDLRKDVETPP